MAIDLASGDRSTVSDNTTYSGNGLSIDYGSDGLVMDAAGNRLLFISSGLSVVAVSLADGDRSMVSGSTKGTGVSFLQPVDLTFDPDRNRIYVADQGHNAVIVVNPNNGDRVSVLTQR